MEENEDDNKDDDDFQSSLSNSFICSINWREDTLRLALYSVIEDRIVSCTVAGKMIRRGER